MRNITMLSVAMLTAVWNVGKQRGFHRMVSQMLRGERLLPITLSQSHSTSALAKSSTHRQGAGPGSNVPTGYPGGPLTIATSRIGLPSAMLPLSWPPALAAKPPVYVLRNLSRCLEVSSYTFLGEYIILQRSIQLHVYF